jgi:hypothetical protein
MATIYGYSGAASVLSLVWNIARGGVGTGLLSVASFRGHPRADGMADGLNVRRARTTEEAR